LQQYVSGSFNRLPRNFSELSFIAFRPTSQCPGVNSVVIRNSLRTPVFNGSYEVFNGHCLRIITYNRGHVGWYRNLVSVCMLPLERVQYCDSSLATFPCSSVRWLTVACFKWAWFGELQDVLQHRNPHVLRLECIIFAFTSRKVDDSVCSTKVCPSVTFHLRNYWADLDAGSCTLRVFGRIFVGFSCFSTQLVNKLLLLLW
jgi:hypothetical protein